MTDQTRCIYSKRPRSLKTTQRNLFELATWIREPKTKQNNNLLWRPPPQKKTSPYKHKRHTIPYHSNKWPYHAILLPSFYSPWTNEYRENKYWKVLCLKWLLFLYLLLPWPLKWSAIIIMSSSIVSTCLIQFPSTKWIHFILYTSCNQQYYTCFALHNTNYQVPIVM